MALPTTTGTLYHGLNKFYEIPSIFSIVFATVTILFLNCGVLKTELNRSLITAKFIYVLCTSIALLVLGLVDEENLLGDGNTYCNVLGPIFEFGMIGSFCQFTLISMNLLSVLRNPFRSQKYNIIIYFVPSLIAGAMVFFYVMTRQVYYRGELGLCWVQPSSAEVNKLNPLGFVFFYVWLGIAGFTGFATLIYLLYTFRCSFLVTGFLGRSVSLFWELFSVVGGFFCLLGPHCLSFLSSYD